MGKNHKIGIAGFGSIGKRHLSNIINVLDNKGYSYTIDLIRTGNGQVLDEGVSSRIHQIYYGSQQIPDDYDVIFVTNPTHLHYETVKFFAPKTSHMFIEKPVFDKFDLSVEELSLKNDGVYYVACPLRYTGVIQYLKNNGHVESVYSARVISSSYLPDWRPNIDYRTTYSASAEQGGGVSKDIIHEWDYLYYLFGYPEQVLNIRGKFSALQISSDDLSIYIAKYKKMAVEVHLDYFGRVPIREIQLFTEEDIIIGDLIHSQVRYLKSGSVFSFHEWRNDYQVKEIEYFFDILEGNVVNHNDITTAMNILRIAQTET